MILHLQYMTITSRTVTCVVEYIALDQVHDDHGTRSTMLDAASGSEVALRLRRVLYGSTRLYYVGTLLPGSCGTPCLPTRPGCQGRTEHEISAQSHAFVAREGAPPYVGPGQ